MDPAVSPPQHQCPVAEIDGLVGEILTQNAGIVGDAQMVAVMIAADVEDRCSDRPERFGHLGLEPPVRIGIDVRDAVAQIDDPCI